MKIYVLLAIGGFIGAISRYALSSFIQSKHNSPFPYGTFIINLTGSFLLGFLFRRHNLHPEMFLLLGTGFLGAYTTFSTFEFESIELIKKEKVVISVLYLTVSVVLGVILAYLGYLLGAFL
ncbi:fluoride efflux transporter CrcB [Desulforamulus aeronauticus]|uniref:Fluoride-specific ion channel FluC n=1 Tax=Desulforamulus aeronauticus DSM 10349 TaxID=1121421 RepID=A0A1M6NCH4_9FIRM|nr:fluoride efflux transporter CrcB [Desulforamulus aeronauticus]SHJ93377.1 camphor resistance protein CrcB [Desulforamulus aeronauticus DSM 10349]